MTPAGPPAAGPAAPQFDLARYLRPGDRVVWGQACAEPLTLTGLLAAQRHRLPGLRCFTGIQAGGTFPPGLAGPPALESYCGTGINQALHQAGELAIYPVAYSALPGLLAGGALAADAVLVQVSAADEHGRHSLALADDYFSAALDTARVVIAEINDQAPAVPGARTLTAAGWTAAVRTSRPPAEFTVPPPSAAIAGVARQVSELIEDGATVQYGIGAVPEACLDALSGHRDLGLHSGLLSDAAMRLIAGGAATGARKTLDRGVAVGGMLLGSAGLFRFAAGNQALALRGTGYTHDPQVLAAQHQFAAVNSALEVDLTGQVNAEVAGGRYVGAVGGLAGFLRAAGRSPGGLPVIALPSTAGAASRIVARLSGPVTVPRSDAGIIVTEYGAADLRGVPLAGRPERMLAIAHPGHRAGLETGLAKLEAGLKEQPMRKALG